MKDLIQKFECNHFGSHILHEYDTEEEDIYEMLDRFKYFLMAKSYNHEMVERIMYLDDAEFAKLKLLDK